jgi:actin-related protein
LYSNYLSPLPWSGNIIPVGGTSMLQGFNERLQRQLAGSVASVLKFISIFCRNVDFVYSFFEC